MEHFNPSLFGSESFQASLSGDFAAHIGFSFSLGVDDRGGLLYGRSVSVGIGYSPTVISADVGFEFSKIIYIKDLR